MSNQNNDDFELMPVYLQDLIQKRKFSVHNPPPNTSWKLKKKNPDGQKVGIAAPGEFFMVYGAPKSRKSTLLNSITSSAYLDDDLGTLGFEFDMDEDEQILYLDTEMAMAAFHRRQVKLNHMCGYGGIEDLPGFEAYSLKPYTWEQRIHQISHFVNQRKTEIGLIIIDQMADLVMDINDRESTSRLIDKIAEWTDVTGAILGGALHVSKNSSLMTGVIGHELSKKMDSGFYVEKMRETKQSKVVHLLSREEDVETFYFTHNEYGYPVLVVDENNHEDF